ncbi:hypothetical protein ACVI1I_004167 [Bradyrhizobium sp. USDA 4459]
MKMSWPTRTLRLTLLALATALCSTTALSDQTIVCPNTKNNMVSGMILWHLSNDRSLVRCTTYNWRHQKQLPDVELPLKCKFDTRSRAQVGRPDPIFDKPPEANATGETCYGEINYQCSLWCE